VTLFSSCNFPAATPGTYQRRAPGANVRLSSRVMRKLGGICKFALATCASLTLGCAALPWPAPAPPPSAAAGAEAWLDLRGVVHVHTEGSHDSPGTLDELLAAARATGVRFVAVTEHTKPGTPPPGGDYDGVLVIPGLEISAAEGSILALGVSERPPRFLPPDEVVRFVHARGGAAFVGHFERSGLADPAAFAAAAPDGIEIVNLHAEANARRTRLALRLLTLPARTALRTLLADPRRNFERWEALPDANAIVGGVDAHAKFRLFGRYGALDRYRDMFGLLTTHVRVREASAAEILAALRAGRSYVALEALAPVDRFDFALRGRAFEMAAPQACRLALVCDGREVGFRKARIARIALPAGARRCRAEATLRGRLWIVTSYASAERTTAATSAIWPGLSSAYIGSAMESRDSASATGKSPGRTPRSR
jgi:hypothetical protein